MKLSKLTALGFSCLVAVPTTLIGLSGPARADSRCSDVNIQVTNDFRDPITNARVDIKVVDFKYWDDEDNKWRNEATTNRRIDPNQTAVWNKALEYVGGENRVKVKAYYRYSQAGGGWSTKYTKVSSRFQCVDGTTVPITIR